MSDAGDAAKFRATAATPEPDPHSGLAIVLPHVLRAFRREPALALTVAYLLAALAGIYYDYAFYQKGFDIPILSLSQIGDYLVAGLQQPVAIALVLVTFPLCWLLDRLNASYRRRQAIHRDRLRSAGRLNGWRSLYLRYLDWQMGHLWGLQLAYLLVIFIYGWVFVSLYAKQRVAEVERGGAAQVAIRMSGAAADLPSQSGTSWTYLGAVSNYVFLYDQAKRQTLILPVNALGSVRPVPAGRAATRSGQVATKP